MVVPSVLRGWWVIAAIPVVALASMRAASYADDGSAAGGISEQGFVVLLAGVTTASFLRLVETVKELRPTREELARGAVDKERVRFSRDLHDLLGHTLSVVVVKAQAGAGVGPRDPDAAAGHGRRHRAVGREALPRSGRPVTGCARQPRRGSSTGPVGPLRLRACRGVVVRQPGSPPAPRRRPSLAGRSARRSRTCCGIGGRAVPLRHRGGGTADWT